MTRPRHTDGAPSPLLRPALSFARRRKGPLGALGAWSLLESARTFLTGYAVARALDDGFLAGDVRTGLLWLLALAAAALAGGFADAGVFRALGGVIEPLRDSLVRRVVRATLTRAVASPTPADTARVSRLTAQTEIARDAAGGVLLTVRSFLFTSAGAFTGLAALSPRLLPLVLIPLAAGLALFAATLRPMAARQRDLLDADEHLAAFAGRTDHAARDIAATGAAPPSPPKQPPHHRRGHRRLRPGPLVSRTRHRPRPRRPPPRGHPPPGRPHPPLHRPHPRRTPRRPHLRHHRPPPRRQRPADGSGGSGITTAGRTAPTAGGGGGRGGRTGGAGARAEGGRRTTGTRGLVEGEGGR
ncbi:hypothetical protein [Streptomyces sp. S-2]|uniref:hypothetical protein n=1 Tax=Streptomyces sp. S-2 TaxID=2675217 RepID=UPI00210957CB|nr:hypothetical protein [Streptomyces sp. S-2]